MATFDRLIEQKTLIRVTVQLSRDQFHERKFYALPACLKWMRDEVPKMNAGRLASAFTPGEQLNERLRQWMSGDPMRYGRMFHDLQPASDAVWELKTADLRIFGWMYRDREFIGTHGAYADDFKEPTKRRNYSDERRAVVAARDSLPLDGVKFVTGDFDELV